MISDGLILLVVGMVAVFLFLLLLNVLISSMSFAFKDHALREQQQLLAAEEEKRRKKSAKKNRSAAPPAEDTGRLTAVISAAIHAHTNR
ncbi:OadG family protein [Prosthecochloris sp. HL-130-GSB]|jgi:oxaloacetate decarboxylase (Na+ extruding) subunit gamma|uniref:Sodium pump decarboxylase subunit gamma n=1 Tax=Prosthecochloris aestuarii TaxID=1102 RepID=A0A831WP98_PROAE|nr:OadG family protein [Prosthecochloris sp. HL-130-GSB]ARM31028.1 sodium pump decarboxylase subunit gamma [Prosthecochloris sp. HL-130-GSB]MBO8092168.1 OadG family protein [Prosthecochloris sp.]HED31358.1 sodium pump decarboxylase subunit gamma [Prosthecochloris aestuarii]